MGPPGTLPNGLPPDVPVYPPDSLYGLSWVIWKTPGEANLAYNVNVQSPMDKETVHGWYRVLQHEQLTSTCTKCLWQSLSLR